ncbi:putative bifunctional diguanylate cyclase/phosphodiesterase [Alteromonas lipolytica]|uniref:Diguanylate cyclase n=1 Tax=Alteromonas lipolytica TaxID=1856405 RepID=A0A1E8FDJ1_9ALTE|nr:bifunctional diguanylate cyclase/phosphodiesterase [Alteromonas lipolytica]OFI34002.1 hypothetical protein BFC17_20840 [Alteromonas lipolytica]GGF66371.1 hypothetical protein GCM10011338_18300 [Alteromonas lipolytica]
MHNSQLARRARQVYLFIVFLGGILAIGVYGLAASVQSKAGKYMETDLATFSQTQQIGMLLSEQERLLYEYYATSESTLYENGYIQNFNQLTALLQALGETGEFHATVARINTMLDESYQVAKELDVNLKDSWTDWDLAREQLELISQYRRAALPLLNDIDMGVNRSVNAGYVAINWFLDATVWVVAAFALVIAGISIYLGRYAAKFIQLSTENETLALFPKRNPNPVIRIDARGRLLYANPAADKLVASLYPNDINSMASFPEPLTEALKLVSSGGELCAQTILQIDQRYYAIQSHWISEHQTYDLHVRDITLRHRAEQALEHQAYHHPVTGIGNRSFLEKTANQWIGQQQPFNAIMIDISDFKMLSESYGLADALSCIYSVGYYLNSAVEQYGMNNEPEADLCLFHVADACFMVLVKTNGPAHRLAALLAELRTRLNDAIDTPLGAMRFHVTFGVSDYPVHSGDYATLLLHTNIAVEMALKNSKSVHYFNADDGASHQRRLTITRRLEQALIDNQLSLYYQPKQHLQNGQVRSCECLLRWIDNGEFISPGEFIPIAERSGLILLLGEWVLDSAFKQVKHWYSEGREVQVAINISARQFLQPGFTESIERRLKEYQVPPSLIELELTETSIMDNHQLASEVLVELRKLGVSLSIDDFGTGYSSLAYLSAFPVDKVKIDRSFVSQMVDAPKQQAIVLTICQLAHNLGLQVIAEGVETDSQRELLHQYGCDYLQGYLFARPAPASEVSVLFN